MVNNFGKLAVRLGKFYIIAHTRPNLYASKVVGERVAKVN